MGTMTSLLGLEIEQSKRDPGISIHLDTYIEEVLKEYKMYARKHPKPKKAPMQPGVVLTVAGLDCPDAPDPREQKVFWSITAKLQFASFWTRFDTAFTTSQLAWYCASAGPSQRSHWAVPRIGQSSITSWDTLKET